MFIVAPSGSVKENIPLSMPISSATRIVTGRVPLELLVTNAVSIASFAFLRNLSGSIPKTLSRTK